MHDLKMHLDLLFILEKVASKQFGPLQIETGMDNRLPMQQVCECVLVFL